MVEDISLEEPIFIISLDLELAWGFILNPRHKVLNILIKDPKKSRSTVDLLMELFEKFDIPATWAVVGHLFLEYGNYRDYKELISEELPQFKERWLSWELYNRLKYNLLYYGRDIIEKITDSPVEHEIGLHSFFHIPFSQCSREVAKAEIELGLRLAKKFGVAPKSFVFPKNYIGHVDILKNYGFRIYRGKDAGLCDENQNFLIRKVTGAVDKIIAPPVFPLYRDGIWELPSSMCFCDPQAPFTVLPRAKFGLYRSIRSRRIFHIWLHPWSLLLYKRLAEDLEKFFAIVAEKRSEGKLQVMTMGELADNLDRRFKL